MPTGHLRRRRRLPLRDGDHRPDPGGQLHPGQRQHRQQLRQTTCAATGTGPTPVLSCTPVTASRRQQLHLDHLQHGDDVGRSGRHLQRGAGDRRQRLHRHHLLRCHDRPDRGVELHADRGQLRQRLDADELHLPDDRPDHRYRSCTPVAASSGQQLDLDDLRAGDDDQRPGRRLHRGGPTCRAMPGRPRPATRSSRPTCRRPTCSAAERRRRQRLDDDDLLRPTTRPTCRWRRARRRRRPPATAGPRRPARRRPRPARPAWLPARRWRPRLGNSWTHDDLRALNNNTNVPVLSCTPAAPALRQQLDDHHLPGAGRHRPGRRAELRSRRRPRRSMPGRRRPARPTTPPTCRWRPARRRSPASGNDWTATTCPAPVTTGPTPIASCTPIAGDLRQQLDGDDLPGAGHRPTCRCPRARPRARPRATAGRRRPARRRSRPARPACRAAPRSGADHRQQLDDHDLHIRTTPPTSPSRPARPRGPTPGEQLDDDDLPGTDDRQRSDPRCRPARRWRAPPATATRRRSATVQRHEPFRPAPACPSGPTLANGWTTTECNVVTVGSLVPVADLHAADRQCRQQLADDHLPGADRHDQRAGGVLHAGRPGHRQQLHDDHLPGADHDDQRSGGELHRRGRCAAGNSYTTTTCPAPITTGPIGVSSCTASAGQRLATSWTATICTPNNTTNVPVASCAPDHGQRRATAGPRPPARHRPSRPTCRSRAARPAAATLGQQLDHDHLPDADRHHQRAGRELRASAGQCRQRLHDLHLPDADHHRADLRLLLHARRRPTSGNSWTATICTPDHHQQRAGRILHAADGDGGQRLADASPAAQQRRHRPAGGAAARRRRRPQATSTPPSPAPPSRPPTSRSRVAPPPCGGRRQQLRRRPPARPTTRPTCRWRRARRSRPTRATATRRPPAR